MASEAPYPHHVVFTCHHNTPLCHATPPCLLAISQVDARWLPHCAPAMCAVTGPISDPPPEYFPPVDAVMGFFQASYGRWRWQVKRRAASCNGIYHTNDLCACNDGLVASHHIASAPFCPSRSSRHTPPRTRPRRLRTRRPAPPPSPAHCCRARSPRRWRRWGSIGWSRLRHSCGPRGDSSPKRSR